MKQRVDALLVEKGFFQSRTKANEAIKNREVFIDNALALKPSLLIEDSADIKVIAKDSYVSRAGKKLKYFLLELGVDINGKKCLDIGSSTGGFTEVLLENGALSVVAVDVGKDQLHASLKDNPKIVLFEQMNIVDFKLPHEIEVLTCDLSFTSTTSFLKLFDEFKFKYGIFLFKPQFEVGKNAKRDKKGVVKDQNMIKRAKEFFEDSAKSLNWELIDKKESIIKGKEGNAEFFYAFKRA